jgi:hypothetical protein
VPGVCAGEPRVTYATQYDADLEETLKPGPGANQLTVIDERGRTYRVDTQSRKAQRVNPEWVGRAGRGIA